MQMKRKRFLSLVLTVVMVICLMPVSSASAVTMTGGEVLYLKPNSNWTQAGARFAAYFYGSGDTWASMAAVGDGTYVVTVPSGSWTNVIFCRMNPSTTENSWSNKWNQTSDLTYNGTKNLYTVADGAWDNGGGTWATYTYVYGNHEYTVAGDTGLCGADWTVTDHSNDMDLVDGLYVKTYTNIPRGTYYFKVAMDHAWTYAWPSANYKLDTTYLSYTKVDVTIKFNPATTEITTELACAHGGTRTTTNDATCDKGGTETVTCDDCGDELSSTDSPATGLHTYNASGVCSGCGYVCPHASHNIDGICTTCSVAVEHSYVNGFCSVCNKERNVAAQIGVKEYASLSDALAAAQEGDTVILLKAAEVSSLILMNGISVDLNGCTLTAGHVAAYPGSTLIDSAGNSNKGLLVVGKTFVMLQKDNGYLPIWNGTDGYVFVSCRTLNSATENVTENSLTYEFLPAIGKNAYRLLSAGAAASGVAMKVEVSWDKGDDTTGSVVFTYSDALLKAFYDSYNAETSRFDSNFTLGLNGISGKELTFKVYFESTTGVLLECKAANAE